jgi:hypothetical protein
LRGITLETWRNAKDEIIDWLDSSNHQQLHSTLGSVSQMTFDKQTALAILAFDCDQKNANALERICRNIEMLGKAVTCIDTSTR